MDRTPEKFFTFSNNERLVKAVHNLNTSLDDIVETKHANMMVHVCKSLLGNTLLISNSDDFETCNCALLGFFKWRAHSLIN